MTNIEPKRVVTGYRVSSQRLDRTRVIQVRTPGDDHETTAARRQAYRLADRWDREYGSACTAVGLVFAE